jgi:hypothetical protein
MGLLGAVMLPAALFAICVAGCGMSVHNEVTVRALHSFRPTNTSHARYAEYIKRYPTFVQVRFVSLHARLILGIGIYRSFN